MRERRVLLKIKLLNFVKFPKVMLPRTFVCVCVYIHTLTDIHTFSQDMTVTQSVEVTPFPIFETLSI